MGCMCIHKPWYTHSYSQTHAHTNIYVYELLYWQPCRTFLHISISLWLTSWQEVQWRPRGGHSVVTTTVIGARQSPDSWHPPESYGLLTTPDTRPPPAVPHEGSQWHTGADQPRGEYTSGVLCHRCILLSVVDIVEKYFIDGFAFDLIWIEVWKKKKKKKLFVWMWRLWLNITCFV